MATTKPYPIARDSGKIKKMHKWNKPESIEYLYLNLWLLLWDWLHHSKKHKAYYLFSVLFQEAWYEKDNLSMVRRAVYNNTLHLMKDKRHFEDTDDDNIDIYFIEDQKKFFIVLLYNPSYMHRTRRLLDIIPVDHNDYQMTQIFPAPRKSFVKTKLHKKPVPAEPKRGE